MKFVLINSIIVFIPGSGALADNKKTMIRSLSESINTAEYL